MVPSVFALLVCIPGFFSSRAGALQWQTIFCLFGGAAAILLPALGGAVITPSVLFLPFTLYRAFGEARGTASTRNVSPAGFWLAAAVLWGVLGALLFPRLLSGMLEILTIDRTGVEEGAILFPIRPVSGNITQSAYAIGNVATFFGMRALLSKPGRPHAYASAVLILATLNCLSAIMNLAEHYAGFPAILDLVRTAYATYSTYESGGLVRIHGTFPETSAFSAFTLPLFAFTCTLWLDDVMPWWTGPLAALSLLFLVISTSGTAYVALGSYLPILLWSVGRRALSRREARRTGGLVVLLLVLLALVTATIVFDLPIVQKVAEAFDSMVLQKADSESGLERAQWNRQAWYNFLDSYGLGVGLGTARASSFALVLLSNLGAVGTLCYLMFLGRVLGLGRAGREHEEPSTLMRASRHAVLASLIPACVSSTVFDLGIAFYSFAAAATVHPAVDPLPVPEPIAVPPQSRDTLIFS
ncbi:MAG: O-antigen ligase like rane protein [Myxococcaceae bacterium]|nr:O-antigen ligase like rane protein [Myxococcaceae bacterium]